MHDNGKITHKPFICEPTDTKVVDRLRAMTEQVSSITQGINKPLASMHVHDGTSVIIQIEPGVLAAVFDPLKTPKFTGVSMCVHCIQRAALMLRDLATTYEDLAQAVEQHGKSL